MRQAKTQAVPCRVSAIICSNVGPLTIKKDTPATAGSHSQGSEVTALFSVDVYKLFIFKDFC